MRVVKLVHAYNLAFHLHDVRIDADQIHAVRIVLTFHEAEVFKRSRRLCDVRIVYYQLHALRIARGTSPILYQQ